MITDQIDKELLALAKQSDIELDPVYRRILYDLFIEVNG